MSQAPPVARTSADLVAERIAQLKSAFPDVVSEGKVDWDKLRTALGEAVDTSEERFSFNWAGKRDAVTVLQTPSKATLRPCPEESIGWDQTHNLFIEGDNLEVLKLLFKPYFGRVKMIYIDPPYNTGQDFVYPDDFADPLARYLQLTKQTDAAGNLLTSNPETSGRYHSTWLSMMYPRLFLARQLLREDGVIFVSIDDHEVYHLRMLMNEVFGEENFVATIIWQKVYSPKNSARHFSEDHDFILVYARNAQTWQPQLLPRSAEANARYENADDDERGPWKSGDMTARNYYSQRQYEVTSPSGNKFRPSIETYWRVSFQNGGNRRFIGVQLPEPSPKPEKEKTLKTMAEVGKERIRHDIAKPKGETGNLTETEAEDLGFKVFKFDKSNFTDNERGNVDPIARMSLFVDPLIHGWEPIPVIWEVAVKEAGFGLNSAIEKVEIKGAKKLYRVADPERDQSFHICLDETIVLDTLKALNLSKDDLFVCRDAALDDTAAANLALQCRLRTI